MEHKVYAKQTLKKQSFFQKVLGQKIKENALIELNNLLAAKQLKDITAEEVHEIAQKYGVNFQTDYDAEVSDFYKNYLKQCLEDKFISEEELQDLKELKRILLLNDKKVDEIHQQLAGEIYRNAVEQVIEDGELDEQERAFIEKLQNDLKLPQNVANDIYEKSGQELIQSYMNSAIADAKLTPQEEKQLHAIAKNLNVELKEGVHKSDLEKYKLYWQIENDEMPALQVDLSIPRSEQCYFRTENTAWYEHPEENQAKIYSKSTLTLKIAKGLYWRNANEQNKQLTEGWKMIDKGTLYLTNKRIFFRGENGDKVILLNRILDFVVYQNGIEVEKEGGHTPFLAFEKSSDIFAMLLGKAISQL